MTNNREESSRFHTVQAERDLQANWEVDLAKKLEDYLLKICSGEITGVEDHSISVNFAEAALLLQGSVQVYSRKVEYLYNLVFHALDFLSQKRQQEQSEGSSAQPEQNDSNAGPNEENDQFWVSDDVPVEARNCIDVSTSKDASFYHFVKPPANLVVLEGDCLDNTGDGGELESYLLASNEIYRDFILLDPCDAVAVNEFLKVDDIRKGETSTYRGSSARKRFQSPSRRSGGTARKSVGKNQDADFSQPPIADCSIGVNDCKVNPDHPAADTFGDNNHGFDMDDGYSEPMNLEDSNDKDDGDDDDDDEDPWKPLNPHEPGNLKIKPFRKVKPRRNAVSSAKQISITTLFPLARMCGTISPEFREIWKERCSKSERNGNPSLYEKLRDSLSNGESYQQNDTFGYAENDNGDDDFDNGIPDFGLPNEEIPEYMDEELPPNEKCDGSNANDPFGHDDPSSLESLEDLCRSHLDTLLANIAQTENQTELAARVSSWKHKIEHNLEEQDSHAPFDIHAYGERILEKLSLEEDSTNTMPFADVVKGQEKHDVARTFSALLQLVNNGDVNLERREEVSKSICFTATKPFYVHLLNHDKRPNGMQFRFSKKRVKSPKRKGFEKDSGGKFGREKSPLLNSSSQCGFKLLPSQPSCKLSAKLGKVSSGRCTPDGKRRRSSRFVEPVDLHSSQ